LLDVDPQSENLAERVASLGGGLGHASQKEAYPMNQVARQTHASQRVVVTAAIAFKEVRKIERWLRQNSMADQIERNQQTSDTAISVKKRMDGFELVVADGKPDQVWHGNSLVVPELFQITHQFRHTLMMGRNE